MCPREGVCSHIKWLQRAMFSWLASLSQALMHVSAVIASDFFRRYLTGCDTFPEETGAEITWKVCQVKIAVATNRPQCFVSTVRRLVVEMMQLSW